MNTPEFTPGTVVEYCNDFVEQYNPDCPIPFRGQRLTIYKHVPHLKAYVVCEYLQGKNGVTPCYHEESLHPIGYMQAEFLLKNITEKVRKEELYGNNES